MNVLLDRGRRLGINSSFQSINDDAIRAKVGLPNSFTPDAKLLARYYDKVDVGKKQTIFDFLKILRLSYIDSNTIKYLKYLRSFVVGGIMGCFWDAYKEQLARTNQLFPFRKLERHMGDYKRMSFNFPK